VRLRRGAESQRRQCPGLYRRVVAITAILMGLTKSAAPGPRRMGGRNGAIR
jgi:hypothetical protein